MLILSSSGWKSGLREWVVQRFTGIYIGFYFLFLLFYFYFTGGINYLNLSHFFSIFFIKILSILFIFSIILHSSIGMSIIITDYIKNTLCRIVFDFIINFVLLSYVFIVMQIFWGF